MKCIMTRLLSIILFFICSLDDQNKSFPIFMKRKTKGSADCSIIEELQEIVGNCTDVGMDVVGVSFDGDPSYLQYVDEMCA